MAMAPSLSAAASSSSSLRVRYLSSPSSSSSSSSSHPKPSSHTCNHSPAVILDLLFLIVTLFSSTFLIFSFLSYLFHLLSFLLLPSFSFFFCSLSFLLPSFSFSYLFRSLSLTAATPIPLLLLILLVLVLAILLLAHSFVAALARSRRRCGKRYCEGLKQAPEVDILLQSKEAIRASPQDGVWREINQLPSMSGPVSDHPDYKLVTDELRRIVPPNGRAVLIFRLPCGCAISKVVIWGRNRARRTREYSQIWSVPYVRWSTIRSAYFSLIVYYKVILSFSLKKIVRKHCISSTSNNF
ncbi:Ribosomal protein L34Ae protein [Dioscorea alata]|uniref:Ribosomal protein L34Ae protein n=1 Tax=Dioscorea alata TaxID=55571 RepID=A0ACB7V144_DIOAL|nr:Ribosomal protein L34Ae protein [Dioscorea alata]